MAKKNSAKVVEDAEKMAHKLWEEQYGQVVVLDNDGEVVGSKEKPADTPENKPEEEPKEEPAEKEPEEEPTEEPTEEPKEEPVETPQPPPAQEPPKEDFEHKFSVLKGKYDAEVPTLAYELAQANQKIKNLETQLTQPKKEEPAVKEIPPAVLDEDPKIKAFKSDYPDVYEASLMIAQSLLRQGVKPISDKLSKIEESIGKVNKDIGQSAQEKFITQLDGDKDLGKEWRALNKDPEFINWLQTRDIYTGTSKHNVLTAAWERKDPDATLQFFRDYKMTKAPGKPPEKKGKEVNPNKVDPPRGASGGPEETPKEKDQPTVTPAEIAKFYKDQAKGVWRGRDEEAEKEERRLLKAIGAIK